jgi:CRP-like cAMP-binding protein
MYFIEAGQVRVIVNRGTPNEKQVGTIGGGSFFGEVAITSAKGAKRGATVLSATVLRTERLKRDALEIVAREFPAAVHAIHVVAIERRRELGERIRAVNTQLVTSMFVHNFIARSSSKSLLSSALSTGATQLFMRKREQREQRKEMRDKMRRVAPCSREPSVKGIVRQATAASLAPVLPADPRPGSSSLPAPDGDSDGAAAATATARFAHAGSSSSSSSSTTTTSAGSKSGASTAPDLGGEEEEEEEEEAGLPRKVEDLPPPPPPRRYESDVDVARRPEQAFGLVIEEQQELKQHVAKLDAKLDVVVATLERLVRSGAKPAAHHNV